MLALTVALLVSAQLPAADPPEVIALYKQQVEVARRLVDLDRAIRESGAISKEQAETFAETSLFGIRRLAEAECKLDPTPAGRLTAARTMFVSTRDVEGFYRSRADGGLSGQQVGFRATLHRLEAEVELRRTEAAYPAHCPPVTAPFTAPPAGFRGTVKEVYSSGMVAVRPATGLERMNLLNLYRPGQAKPYGQVVVVTLDTTGEPDSPPATVRIGTTVPQQPAGPPHPAEPAADRRMDRPRAVAAVGLVWATSGPASEAKVGDEVRP